MEVLTPTLTNWQVFWHVVGTLLSLGPFAFYARLVGWSSIPMIIYAMILFGPLIGFYLWRKRRQDKILLWQDGLQVIKKSKPGPMYSWQDIRVAEYSFINGYAILQMQDGDRITLFGEKFFGSHRRTRDFVKSTNNRRSELAG